MCGVAQCLRALHRRTLRSAAVRRQQEKHPPKSVDEEGSSNGLPGRRKKQRQPDLCPADVELHSFEVWTPLKNLSDIKLLPLTSCVEDADSTEQQGSQDAEEGDAAELELPKVLAEFGISPRLGEPSPTYKDMCLVAGEIGVSIGRVYTSLTAFTDADSAGTAQLAATRLLLRKAGKTTNGNLWIDRRKNRLG